MTDTQAGIGGDERVVPEPKSPRQSEDKKYAAKSEQIGTDAKKAIADLRSAATKQSYVSWKAIAVAIGRGQEIAQEKAGGNKRGPDYDEAINSYYKKYGLDKLSKDTRSNCQTLCDHDERWKSTQACFDTLPVEKQVTLPRHPKSLLKRFEEQVSWFGEFAAAFPDKMPQEGTYSPQAPSKEMWRTLRKAETDEDFAQWSEEVANPGDDLWARYAADKQERDAWLVTIGKEQRPNHPWASYFAHLKAEAEKAAAGADTFDGNGADAGDGAKAGAGDGVDAGAGADDVVGAMVWVLRVLAVVPTHNKASAHSYRGLPACLSR